MSQRPARRAAASTIADWPSPSLSTIDTNSDLPSAHITAPRASHRASKPTHRVTIRKTPQQVARLQQAWLSTHNPSKEEREKIADEIGLEVRIVSTWFRDERSKMTRLRAEQERGPGPIRNTRIGAKHRTTMAAHPDSDEQPSDEEPVEDDIYVPRNRNLKHLSPQPEITLTDPLDRTKPFSPYSPSRHQYEGFKPANQYGRQETDLYSRDSIYGRLSPSAHSPTSNEESSSTSSGYDSDPREFSALPTTPNYPAYSFTSPHIANLATPSPMQAPAPLQPAKGISFGFERYCSNLQNTNFQAYKPAMHDPWRWGAYDKISSMRQTLRDHEEDNRSESSPRAFNAARMI